MPYLQQTQSLLSKLLGICKEEISEQVTTRKEQEKIIEILREEIQELKLCLFSGHNAAALTLRMG